MKHWYMLAVVGKDKPGIVAHLTSTLFDLGCNLGEASMTRLGGSFAVMLMVNHDGGMAALETALADIARKDGLSVHIDAIDGGLHHHVQPNVAIRVFGADRAGIVAKATKVMAELNLNITSLETEVAGSEAKPLYVMLIEAYAECDIEQVRQRIEALRAEGLDVNVAELDIVLG